MSGGTLGSVERSVKLPALRGCSATTPTDPSVPPDIDYALLKDPDDLRVLTEGVRLMRRVAATPPLLDIAEEERAPGAEDVETWIRGNLQTVYHPVGTCALGKVVDNELRVRGLEGIRVADGSVVPNLMRGHPHPQISMVAMRAAELIRRAPTPAPSSA